MVLNDNKPSGPIANTLDPRRVILDIYTSPGDYNFPNKIEFNMPTVTSKDPILAIEICRVKLIYVGKDMKCVQESVINNELLTRIDYTDRYKNNNKINKILS